MATESDIVIVGGGLVGASLACALADAGIACTLIEASRFGEDEQPSYDERTVALTWCSRRIFEGIGVWSGITDREATAISSIHISDKGHFGRTVLSANDVSTEALGYVVPHRVLGQVFFERLSASPAVSLHCPETATGLTHLDDGVQITLGSGSTLKARLVVVADGGRSGLAASAGMRSRGRDYRQQAMIATLGASGTEAGLAFERFTKSGPLALLPAAVDPDSGESRYVMAWTLEPRDAARLIDATEQDFLAELSSLVPQRVGTLNKPTGRRLYPLKLSSISHPVAPRVVAIGNAAHTVHPVAGQGFNLGLRDVGALADLVFQAHGQQADPGDPAALRRYAHSRQSDTRHTGWLTDGLIRIFANDVLPLALARNAGLSAINLLAPARRALLRQTMGLNAGRSTLALGLPLTEQAGTFKYHAH